MIDDLAAIGVHDVQRIEVPVERSLDVVFELEDRGE
jgi:hypothetical protein